MQSVVTTLATTVAKTFQQSLSQRFYRAFALLLAHVAIFVIYRSL